MIHHLQVLSILSVHLFILIGNVWTGTENKNHLKPVTLLHTVRKRFLTQNRNIYTPFTETVKIHLDNVNTNNDYPVMFPCLDLCPSAPPHSLNYPEFNSFDPIHNGVDAENEFEEAATCLGASRWQTFSKIIFPSIAPALLTGFAMAFARGVGEYGSVIFIAGNMPMISEITPLIIIGKLEQYDYAGATAVATVMLVPSFILLLIINGLQAWQRRHSGAPV